MVLVAINPPRTVIPLKTIIADKHSEETHPPEDCKMPFYKFHFILYHFQQSTTSGHPSTSTPINSSIIGSLNSQPFQDILQLQRQSILQPSVLSTVNHFTTSFNFNANQFFNHRFSHSQPLHDILQLQRQSILQSSVLSQSTTSRHPSTSTPINSSIIGSLTVNHFTTSFNTNQFF